MIELSAVSLEYIRVKVLLKTQRKNYDMTQDVVRFAFTDGGSPETANWVDGSWETETLPHGNVTNYARCLVGPGGTITLGTGVYAIWVKVMDDPEHPAQCVGDLHVT